MERGRDGAAGDVNEPVEAEKKLFPPRSADLPPHDFPENGKSPALPLHPYRKQ